jgi:hypothetical protein
MTVKKSSSTITFVVRDDGIECMIAKVKGGYEVYIAGRFTGYKFRSMKKAVEYCELGF